ncbi:hypothetical protein GCM10010095_83420 [Streptomyces anthocyanicus]|nr:hypothetical protein GCM10010095_83420 [Streptomyces anthocyanicus]
MPKNYRRGRQMLIRTDSAGGTHDFVSWLAKRGRWLSYSVGMVITETIHQHVLKIPAPTWTPAVEADGTVRDGAWAAELTGSLLDGRPQGMRLIVHKERPHPGAQLRITDADGMRITCFATSAPDRPIAELELRHRLEVVQIAVGLLAWMPTLALTGQARLWEPRRLRFRLFSTTAQLVTTGRRRILRLARHWPWTGEVTGAPRTACTPAEPRLTSTLPAPTREPAQTGAVEPGVHPRRHTGPGSARHQLSKAKRFTDSVGGPSCKIEVNLFAIGCVVAVAGIWAPGTGVKNGRTG